MQNNTQNSTQYMQKPVSYVTIAVDLFWIQLTWTFIAAGIMLIINVIKFIFGNEIDTFYNATYVAGNIYMLVIGIIVISFLTYYVEHGVTRRSYFRGGVLASLALSIVIPIIVYIISLIERLIASPFSSVVFREETLGKVDVDVGGNLLGELILANILTPFVDPSHHLILSLAIFSLHLFVFYLIGWLIGAGFQRLGVIGGIVIIFVGLALIMVKDAMVRLVLDMPLYQNFEVLGQVPDMFAMPLVFVVIFIVIALIYTLTKRAPIKI